MLLCIVGTSLYYTQHSIISYLTSPQKKILILTSSGGGGNLEASNAIKAYLDNHYEIQLCHVFKETLGPLDPFSTLTFKKYSSEDVYNTLMPGKHFKLLDWIYQFGRWYIQSQKEKIIPLIRNYFITTKPDLIISAIPVVNNIVLEIAQELDIPFLLIPTDLDLSVYTTDIVKPSYDKFHLGLIFDNHQIRIPIEEMPLPNDHIHLLGAPLRPDFFTKKNKIKLQEQYHIPKNKPTIMVLMGSQGADEIEKYAQKLLTINEPCHLIICIGKNEKSSQDLAKISFPDHISTSIIGFTPHISDYMAVSDLLITKSGTLSVCEALYMNLPLFLDETSTLLPWEKFNHHFIKQHEFGLSIRKYDDVAPLISNVLQHPDESMLYRRNIEKLPKKNFGEELMNLVKKILD